MKAIAMTQLTNTGTKLTFAPAPNIPPLWQGLLAQAIVDHQEGKLDEAIATYKKAVKVIPDHPHLHYLLGTALIQKQSFPKAEVAMRRAVELAGQSFEYLNNLASALMGQSKYSEAETILQKAQKINPDSMDVLANLGVVLGELGRWSEAMLHLSRVRLERPDMRKILRHLGFAYCIAKDWPRAIEIIEDYLTGEPKDDIARNNLAMAYRAINEREGMLATLKDLYENNPDNLSCLSNYYHHLVTFGRIAPALDVLERYAKNNPMDITINGLLSRHHFRYGTIDQSYVHARLVQMVKEFNPLSYMDPLTIYPRVLDFDGFDSLNIDLVKFVESTKDGNSTMNVAFLSLLPIAWTDQECEALYQMHKNWGDRLLKLSKEEPGVAEIPTLHPRNPDDKKLRVGFLSSDIRGHVVSKFIQGFIEHYDHDLFEIYLYINTQDIPDPIQMDMISHATGYQHVYNFTNVDVAKKIIGDRIDILFDLNAHTGESRLGAMTHQCAPIQVTWLGYPYTTGLSTIDYILVDQWLCPPEGRWLVEKPLIKKGSFISIEGFPNVEIKPDPPFIRNDGIITFGSMNNPYKINRRVIQLWSQVLQAVPNSRFVFARPANEMKSQFLRHNLIQEFERNGIDKDRITLMENVANRHLPLYNEIDISLDTFPVTGGTTTTESLWMGTPVIIRYGPALHHRIGYSIVMAVGGMEDLCADNDADYVAAAARLANDPERIKAMRTTLRDQMIQSSLGDTRRFVKDFQDALIDTARKEGLIS